MPNSTGKSLSEALLFAEHGNSMNNLSSYCGLDDAKIRASEKDLPIKSYFSEKFKKIKVFKISLISF